MKKPIQKTLLLLLLIYGMTSLIHNIHNAEFLADYPNLPESWTRAGVYTTWLVTTAIGVGGWILMLRGFTRIGLTLLGVYAMIGLISLGHYVVASFLDHSLAMNLTILLEVTAAALVLLEVVNQILGQRGNNLTHGA